MSLKLQFPLRMTGAVQVVAKADSDGGARGKKFISQDCSVLFLFYFPGSGNHSDFESRFVAGRRDSEALQAWLL